MPFLAQPLPTALGDPDGTLAVLESLAPGIPYIDEYSDADIETAVPLARQVARLRGPAYPSPDGSANAGDALALGLGLMLSSVTQRFVAGEAFPGTSVYALIDEWEAMLGVSHRNLPLADRQALLLARWRTRYAGTPQAILRAIAPLALPTYATIAVTVIGFDATYPIPSGSQLSHASGALYDITSTSVTIVAGVGTVQAKAAEPGSASNRVATDVLTYIDPPSGVGTSAAVDSVIADGADAPTMRETTATEAAAAPARIFVITIRTTVSPFSPLIVPIRDVVGVMVPTFVSPHFTDGSLTAGFFCDGYLDSVTDNTVLNT